MNGGGLSYYNGAIADPLANIPEPTTAGLDQLRRRDHHLKHHAPARNLREHHDPECQRLGGGGGGVAVGRRWRGGGSEVPIRS